MIDDRARGGQRSTRTFFQEGRWRSVYEQLRPGDLVLMQFGHNDAAEKANPSGTWTSRATKNFFGCTWHKSRERGPTPITSLLQWPATTPWTKRPAPQAALGPHPDAAKAVAEETGAALIDLNQLSMDAFSARGREYVTSHYFMNLPAGKYPAYPDGHDDNTHFQPQVRARLPTWFLFPAGAQASR